MNPHLPPFRERLCKLLCGSRGGGESSLILPQLVAAGAIGPELAVGDWWFAPDARLACGADHVENLGLQPLAELRVGLLV
eukprot:2972691-Prymnesium_polylepis.2